jgi:hypothetical protein
MDGYEAISALQLMFVDHQTLGANVIKTFMPKFTKKRAGYPVEEDMDTDEDAEVEMATRVHHNYQSPQSHSAPLTGHKSLPIATANKNTIQDQGKLLEFRRKVVVEYGAIK